MSSPTSGWNRLTPISSPMLDNGYRSVSDSEEAYFTHVKQRRDRINRRFIVYVGLAVVALSVLGLLFSRSGRHMEETAAEATTSDPDPDLEPLPSASNSSQNVDDPYGPSHNLRGPPTMNFRDNLLPDKKYITSWISAGWTNDVMTYINLIYLGVITDRIPVLAMFTPSHVGGTVPPIPFGDVFDVPRLRQSLQKPVLEWREVKNSSSREIDELGCWNVWEAVQDRGHYPRHSAVPDLLSLDLSYTTGPKWLKLIPNFEHDLHTTFWSLAVLAFPEGRRDNLIPPRESEHHHVKLPPDEQLLCYDFLYFVCAAQPYEFEYDYSPAWRFVGQYLHWTPQLEGLVDLYVRKTIGVPDGEVTPAWITVHIRRGDFNGWCGDVPPEDCFAPLSAIARRVQEVKEELSERRGIVVDKVIITSDEKDEAWWADVRERGWYQVDHSETAEKYGAWYPVLIDAGIQSGGIGFVGTDRSTMSIMARRRVQSWRNGVVRTVKWGRPGADDH